MREGIHPQCEKTTITCHCGNVIEVLEINAPKKDLTVTGLDHSLLTEEVRNDLLSTDFRLL